jgi:hypothetical protein
MSVVLFAKLADIGGVDRPDDTASKLCHVSRLVVQHIVTPARKYSSVLMLDASFYAWHVC